MPIKKKGNDKIVYFDYSRRDVLKYKNFQSEYEINSLQMKHTLQVLN